MSVNKKLDPEIRVKTSAQACVQAESAAAKQGDKWLGWTAVKAKVQLQFVHQYLVCNDNKCGIVSNIILHVGNDGGSTLGIK